MPWNLNYRWIFLPIMEVQLYFNLNHGAGFKISRKIRWSKPFLLSLKSSTASPSLLLPSCKLLSPNSWSTLTDDSTWTMKCRHVLPTKEGDLFKKLNEALSVYKSLRILFYYWFHFFTHTGSYQYKTLFGSWNMDKWKIVFTTIQSGDCAYSKPNGKSGFKTFYHKEV